MESRACEEWEGPFPCESDDAEDEVEDLEHRGAGYGRVEVFGEEVPEDFWPEEAFYCGCYLICSFVLVYMELDGMLGEFGVGHVQAAAVRTTRRAQWFLINFPMAHTKIRD